MWTLPWWHKQLEKRASDRRIVTNCPVIMVEDSRFPEPGYVPCNPEGLRQAAEKQLVAWQLWPRGTELPLDVYSAARMIRPGQTIEEKAAMLECIMRQADAREMSVSDLSFAHRHNLRLYGTGQSRRISTELDPVAGDIVLAEFVLSGATGNFTRGGDSWIVADPRLMPQVKAFLMNHVWVGELPNVRLIVGRSGTVGVEDTHRNARALAALEEGISLGAPPAPPEKTWRESATALVISGLLATGITYAIAEQGGRRWKDW